MSSAAKPAKKNPPVKYHSITFEVSFMYSLILGIILLIFSGVLYFILFRAFYTELDKELELTATNISSSIYSYMEVRGEEAEPLKFALERTIEQKEEERRIKWFTKKFEKRWMKNVDQMDLSDFYVSFISINRASISRSPSMTEDMIDLFRESVDLTEPGATTFQTLKYVNKKMRVINFPFTYKGEEKYMIQVGVYQEDIIDLILNWLTSVMISIPIILILTSFIGSLFVKRILKPVEETATIARRISKEDLSSRVETKNVYKEVKYLIDDFNDMIDRLERSFNHIEEFSAHVAHELKTPLTIIKGETELAMLEERSMEDYKRAMQVNLEEVEKMLRIINDLLLLTKIDYQPEVFMFESVDFVAYFNDILSQAKFLAKSKSIRISTNIPDDPIMINADKVHLRRLFFNIIDNAIKFTPDNGFINIKVHAQSEQFTVSIEDSGNGISPEDLKKIFDRFFRSANSSERGYGLGLSIAQSIAHLHKGSITVESEIQVGTTFHITLPKTSI